MSDTTIKVDSAVRDRLALLATERSTTIRAVVEQYANSTPTRAEQAAVYEHAKAYIREHLCPDMDEGDLTYGEWFWRELRAGRVPEVMDGRIPEPGE